MNTKAIAHIEAAASGFFGSLVAFGTTFVGTGTPSVGVQATIAAIGGVFTYLVSLWHRFKDSGATQTVAQAAKEVKSGGVPSLAEVTTFIREVTPLYREIMTDLKALGIFVDTNGGSNGNGPLAGKDK